MMGKVWRLLLLALLLNASLATMALARAVYLADGGIIQAQKVWKEEGRIYVLLNRDSLITFSPEEINLKKTFAPGRQPAAPKAGTKSATAVVPAAQAPAVAATGPGATAKPAAVPPATPAPAAAPASVKPAATAATPAAVPPAAAPVKTTPAAAPATTAPAPAPAQVKPAATAAPPAVTPPVKPATPAPAPAPVAKKPAPVPRPVAAAPVPEKGSETLALAFLGAGLLLFLLLIASFWKVFAKAGQAGWKSLVPIYNLHVLLQMAGCPGWWLLMFFLPVVNIYFLVVMHIRLAEKFGKTPLFGFALCFFGFIFFPILAFGPATYGEEETFTFEEG